MCTILRSQGRRRPLSTGDPLSSTRHLLFFFRTVLTVHGLSSLVSVTFHSLPSNKLPVGVQTLVISHVEGGGVFFRGFINPL